MARRSPIILLGVLGVATSASSEAGRARECRVHACIRRRQQLQGQLHGSDWEFLHVSCICDPQPHVHVHDHGCFLHVHVLDLLVLVVHVQLYSCTY